MLANELMMERQEQTTMMQSRLARVATALFVGALALFVAGSAVAADSSDKKGDKDEDVPEGPLGDELEDYWSVDREVDVIKQRLYKRKGRFGVGLHAGMMSSEPFFWYLPAGLRLDYYISNNWGIELEGSYMDAPKILRHRTDLADFVVAEKGEGFEPETHALDQFKWRAHALAVWHPLYGKLSVLQRKLTHFDFNLAAGLGAVSVTRPNETRTDSKELVTPEVVYGGGVQFFATDSVVIRVSGRGYIYRGPRRYKNTESDERVVSAPPRESNSKELNFVQELEFPTEFLIGATYMF